MDIKDQIARVIKAQQLSHDDAAEQVRGRIYEARQYLAGRSTR